MFYTCSLLWRQYYFVIRLSDLVTVLTKVMRYVLPLSGFLLASVSVTYSLIGHSHMYLIPTPNESAVCELPLRRMRTFCAQVSTHIAK